MRFGFGLVTCQRPPSDPRTDADVYRDAIARCVAAEAAGFDSVWTSEHHFVDDGYMSSLLTMNAAIAQATERVEIGTAVLLAPLHDPIRVAEDAATVDLISGGRAILGLGAGWRAEEFDVFGVPQRERVRRIREMVRVCRGAWGPEAFEHGGHTVNVTPKPARPIPIWLGGFAEPAVRRSARIADGFIGSSSGTQLEAFRPVRDMIDAELAERGRDRDAFSFALHVPVYVGEWDEVRPYYQYLRWKYPDMGAARASVDAKSPPPLDGATEEQLRSTIVCGGHDEVVAGVARFREVLGDDIHFIFRSDFPGMPQEESMRLIHRLKDVIAEVGA